jgi:hypothetical protein
MMFRRRVDGSSSTAVLAVAVVSVGGCHGHAARGNGWSVACAAGMRENLGSDSVAIYHDMM